jgi:hypothetical protein
LARGGSVANDLTEILAAPNQISFLETNVFGGVPGLRELYRIETVNLEGQRFEFWIAGCL